jgi:hypothetical protein
LHYSQKLEECFNEPVQFTFLIKDGVTVLCTNPSEGVHLITETTSQHFSLDHIGKVQFIQLNAK